MIRSIALTLILGAAAVLSSAVPAAAVTVAGPGRTTVSTSDMVCSTIMNVAFGTRTQTIDVFQLGVTSSTTMPSGRARWTAYLQWSPATGTPRWQNWTSKSVTANAAGLPGALYVPFGKLTWSLNVPANTYLFRVQHKIEFLNGAGTPVAWTGWILGDSLSTYGWILGQGLGNDVNMIEGGQCAF